MIPAITNVSHATAMTCLFVAMFGSVLLPDQFALKTFCATAIVPTLALAAVLTLVNTVLLKTDKE